MIICGVVLVLERGLAERLFRDGVFKLAVVAASSWTT